MVMGDERIYIMHWATQGICMMLLGSLSTCSDHLVFKHDRIKDNAVRLLALSTIAIKYKRLPIWYR